MAAAKKIKSSTAGIKTNVLPESPTLRREFGPEEVSHLTVGGIPLNQIPGGHLIPYLNTDQGIAERESRPHATAQVTRSDRRAAHTATDIDQQIRERRDFRENEFEQWDAP